MCIISTCVRILSVLVCKQFTNNRYHLHIDSKITVVSELLGRKSALVLPLNNFCVCLESLACLWIGIVTVEITASGNRRFFVSDGVRSTKLLGNGFFCVGDGGQGFWSLCGFAWHDGSQGLVMLTHLAQGSFWLVFEGILETLLRFPRVR